MHMHLPHLSFLFKTGDLGHVPGIDRLLEKEDAHAHPATSGGEQTVRMWSSNV